MNAAGSNRRSFLAASLASGALLGLKLAQTQALGALAGVAGDFKLSLAEWSLHRALFAHKITNLDFPKLAREQYGVEGLEFVNQFFMDKAHDSEYLKDLKTRANDHGLTCVLIMIDGEGDMMLRARKIAPGLSRTTRNGSTPRPPWAVTRSGSTPAGITALRMSAAWPKRARR